MQNPSPESPETHRIIVTALYDSTSGARRLHAKFHSVEDPELEEENLDFRLWRSDLIDLPDVYDWIRQDAIASDVLALTFSPCSPTSPRLIRLVADWARQRRGSASALIVLADELSPRQQRAIATFRVLTSISGLHLILSAGADGIETPVLMPSRESATPRPINGHARHGLQQTLHRTSGRTSG